MYEMFRTSFHIASRSFMSMIGDTAEDHRLTDADTVTIEFHYPLSNPVQRTFQHAGGFTLTDFANAVADGYEQIYAEEERTRTTDPTPTGLLLNRGRTNGVHGIWGHGIRDLVLETVHQDGEVWKIGVGS